MFLLSRISDSLGDETYSHLGGLSSRDIDEMLLSTTKLFRIQFLAYLFYCIPIIAFINSVICSLKLDRCGSTFDQFLCGSTLR